ncbi:50S ribosomal protein L23 [Cardiobacterium valvarum]|uniref:50S ribosomal protein L23 n=1 Tax=Cardiobacterium valvarum TaxID=194702 RepID=UPI0002D7F189
MSIADKQIVFRVAYDANKKDIKIAVEQLLDVKVVAVNTVNVKGKSKRFGQRQGYRKSFKKAYISLGRDVDMEALLSEQQA